jgi:DNA polymerase I-like protein with 3'-5' exonuclease and polymerase domains
VRVVLNQEQLKEVVSAYSKVDSFVFDVETMGDHRGDPRQNKVVWIALSTYDRVDVIPMGHPNGQYIRTDYPLLPSAVSRQEKGLELRPTDYSKDERKATKVFSEPPEQLTPGEVFKALKPLLNSDKVKGGHNLKFDLESVAKYIGGLPEPSYFCTLNAAFILNNQNRNGLGLDDCLAREFDYHMVKGVGKEIEKYSFDEVATYAGLDAEWTWKLYKHYDSLLDADGLRGIFNLEMDVLQTIAEMELRGADIDVDQLEKLKDNLEEQLEATKGQIYSIAGYAFNINSVPEKQKILFTSKKDGGRGIKPKILTPAGAKRVEEQGLAATVNDYSVAEPALEMFRGKDALVDAMATYADLNKLLTTYVIPYLGGDITRTLAGKSKVVAKDSLLYRGRIHTDFVQYGAETGRFSSRNPNLQNVPAPHTANGKAIRNLFVAPEGHKLVVADYSQIEPRIIASFSNDRTMVNAYLNSEDIYTAIGNTMGVDRKAGKVLVLSLAYGVGPDKIAREIGCSLTEARELLDSFTAKFPAVGRYKRMIIADARRRSPIPYVSTILKRRRYLPDLRSKEQWKRSRAERQAFNTVIQGSAADLIKVAMVRARNLIPDGSSMILTVHDEIVTVTPDHLAEETAAAIREAMEGVKALSVPMLADVKIVQKWGEAK